MGSIRIKLDNNPNSVGGSSVRIGAKLKYTYNPAPSGGELKYNDLIFIWG